MLPESSWKTMIQLALINNVKRKTRAKKNLRIGLQKETEGGGIFLQAMATSRAWLFVSPKKEEDNQGRPQTLARPLLAYFHLSSLESWPNLYGRVVAGLSCSGLVVFFFLVYASLSMCV